MFTVIGDAVIVVNDPGYKEVAIPIYRGNEVLIHTDYTKGDESGLLIQPVLINTEIGNSKEYAIGIAKSVNPIQFNPLLFEINEDSIGMITVPIHKLIGSLKLKITFNDLGAGTEGDLEIGLKINKL